MRRSIAIVGVVAALIGQASAATAHGPDPLLGTTPWAQNQVVEYEWKSGQEPPAWAASNIDLGAADSGATRASKAALFERAESAVSQVAYGGPHPCPSYGIACMNRSGVPVSFGMWFRPHGAVLDWAAAAAAAPCTSRCRSRISAGGSDPPVIPQERSECRDLLSRARGMLPSS